MGTACDEDGNTLYLMYIIMFNIGNTFVYNNYSFVIIL